MTLYMVIILFVKVIIFFVKVVNGRYKKGYLKNKSLSMTLILSFMRLKTIVIEKDSN
jgi:hypothetical protein